MRRALPALVLLLALFSAGNSPVNKYTATLHGEFEVAEMLITHSPIVQKLCKAI